MVRIEHRTPASLVKWSITELFSPISMFRLAELPRSSPSGDTQQTQDENIQILC